MATVQITSKNFSETINKGGILLLDWWAPWCGPCRAFGPTYERVAAANPDVVFGKINTQEEPELAAQFHINSIPTLMVIRDRAMLYSQPGMVPEKALLTLVEEARKLDMDVVLRATNPPQEQAAIVRVQGKEVPTIRSIRGSQKVEVLGEPNAMGDRPTEDGLALG